MKKTAIAAPRSTSPCSWASATPPAPSSAWAPNPNALDGQRYDIITIASVANDVPMLKLAIEGGASAKNITSPYDGTALIAAAHLGHAEVVRTSDLRRRAARPRQ